MAEENKPEYHSSRAEEYLNYLVDSSDSYPQDKPQSRAEEYLQYLCAHKGEGGGGAEPLIVYTEGTMQTSTLPAIVVPKLTKDQLDNIHTAMSQGKLVLISDGNGHYTVTEIDETYDGVRFVYANAYVDYYVEGDNVICAHTLLEGGGSEQHLYAHEVHIRLTTPNLQSGSQAYVSLKILTDENYKEPFALGTLTVWLYGKGYTGENNALSCSGYYGSITGSWNNYSIVSGVFGYASASSKSLGLLTIPQITNTTSGSLASPAYMPNIQQASLFNPTVIDTVEQIF